MHDSRRTELKRPEAQTTGLFEFPKFSIFSAGPVQHGEPGSRSLVAAPLSALHVLAGPQGLKHGIELTVWETGLFEIGPHLPYFHPAAFDAFNDGRLLFGRFYVLALEGEGGFTTGQRRLLAGACFSG